MLVELANLGRFKKKKSVSIPQQLFHLKAGLPTGRNLSRQRKRIEWLYETQPTPISRKYTVCISYQIDSGPRVFVKEPNLDELSKGKHLPHVYNHKKQRLCLYLPKAGEWNSEKLLIDTIVPWTNLWLYYFENWLVTEEWKGGGEHPEPEKAEDTEEEN